jgi:ABC-type Fe3+/spermidine/putrescine transport system ATPase subunit
MSILSICNLSKSFGTLQALEDISFEVNEGEIVTLLGPSGCGKSTLLAIIAGLEAADQGEILWNNASLLGIAPHLRGFGLMFQDFALFPHMNVYQNIAFGLKMSRMPPQAIEQRVREMLEIVGLPDFSKRDVNTLSGGEQQRIALARALAPHPNLLMLDEPLGSLDRNLRERLVADLQSILHQMNQTAIYVTHDQQEAFTIADQVILMNSGHIEQLGTPRQIYQDPASIFVARFLEMTNIIPAMIHQHNGIAQVTSDVADFSFNSSHEGEVNLLIRPDMAKLDEQGACKLNGIFTSVSFRGSTQRITFIVNHTPLIFEFPFSVALPEPGTAMTLCLNPATAIKIFPK